MADEKRKVENIEKKAETKPETKTRSESKTKPETKARSESKTKPETKAKPKTKAKSEGKTIKGGKKAKLMKVKKKETKIKTTKKEKAIDKGRKIKKEEEPVEEDEEEEGEDKDEEDVEIIDEDLEEEEKEYIVKQKPELTPELSKKLRLRKNMKRKKPKFRRQEWFRYKRLGESWRRPRGLQSKLRKNLKYRINRVRVGYKAPVEVRGLHSSGFKEILVYNRSDLEKLNPKLEAARIGHSVGTKKRIEIEEYADELGIRILNRG